MNFKQYFEEATAIAKGKVVTIMHFNAMSNRRRPTEVKITGYEKQIGRRDTVYFKVKGKPTQKMPVNAFKSRMKEAASISI